MRFIIINLFFILLKAIYPEKSITLNGFMFIGLFIYALAFDIAHLLKEK